MTVIDRIRKSLAGSQAKALVRWRELVNEAALGGKDNFPDANEIIAVADEACISSDVDEALEAFGHDVDAVERHGRAMAGIAEINATIALELTAAKAKTIAGLEQSVRVSTETLRTLESRLATVTGAQTALGHEQADAARAKASSPRMFPAES